MNNFEQWKSELEPDVVANLLYGSEVGCQLCPAGGSGFCMLHSERKSAYTQGICEMVFLEWACVQDAAHTTAQQIAEGVYQMPHVCMYCDNWNMPDSVCKGALPYDVPCENFTNHEVAGGGDQMPVTQKELEQLQNERLFDLLKIRAAMKESAENAALKDAIHRAKAVMSEEQIAWVEKNVNASL